MGANPQNLKPFQPGQSGNPAGRPPNPPELKEIKRLTKGQLELLVNKILFAAPEELKEGFRENVLEIWVASVAASGIRNGDPARLMTLIDRLIGKVTDKMEIEVKPIENWTREEKVQLLEESKERLRLLEEELKRE